MCIKSLLKRFAPFMLTFAVGLFIASFFVTVAAPSFQFRGKFNRHREMDRQMMFENQRLRDENNRLRNRLAEAEKQDWVLPDDIESPVAPSIPMKTVPYKSR